MCTTEQQTDVDMDNKISENGWKICHSIFTDHRPGVSLGLELANFAPIIK